MSKDRITTVVVIFKRSGKDKENLFTSNSISATHMVRELYVLLLLFTRQHPTNGKRLTTNGMLEMPKLKIYFTLLMTEQSILISN